MKTTIGIEDPLRSGEPQMLTDVAVREDAMLTCLPTSALSSAGVRRERRIELLGRDGEVFERWVGGAILTVAGRATIDDVVFAEAGDTIALGWRALSGLNLRVDEALDRLVDRGPISAATAVV